MFQFKGGLLILIAAISIFFWGVGIAPVSANHELEEKGASAEATHKGPLDGMVFTAMLGPDGEPLDVKDEFVFENGTFVSKECELRCDYPARPYFVREVEGKTEFISHTKCPYKDAEIVWHGTIDAEKISGTATWTLKRWYWTVTNRFDFEGQLESSARPVASAE